MADYPTLQPALTVQVKIAPPTPIGSNSRKCRFLVIPIVGGNVKGESGFSPALNGEFIGQGNDYIHMDPDEKRLRLDAHGVVKTTDDATIYIHYNGVVDVTPELGQILSGQAESLVTPYGHSFIHITFETGDERYADLENGVYVGAGHFIYNKGESTIVEYKVSKVAAAK
ncbi:hypothetical protein VTO42DRAFT_2374 [Malbranchea cinnamomea]